ncbi:hypothetical protein SAMN02745912_02824 [Paramaledivibacter caminithermalis DSM 15212]|jgi:hypothetical protein|uniref:Uncharacterized protein n=1 Tax=Paramaledivibacter caminithermalis (strain DSM 15212 / CIP 107654 / DViRD3) TaxID=1121301 RepID=A0A1M6R2Y8_PARC5|nr:hypothetical protein SAMN02745912_02824 [Paramaledivibacter caminithermalis DSM 15212]
MEIFYKRKCICLKIKKFKLYLTFTNYLNLIECLNKSNNSINIGLNMKGR